jgi:SAM-dependent methyltransferase
MPTNVRRLEPETRDEPQADPHIDSNYRYWRDHGGEWADEYARRKRVDVSLHLQELMLTEYVLNHARSEGAPFEVLELGCGVGRHLRNLAQLPGVAVFGYDQSRAMAEQCLRWAGREWFDEHVTVGLPTGPLPYADGAFDLVYTAEVLVHVRPEHLDGVLSELVRIARGHILHLETSQHTPLVGGEHSGCWRHDLPAAYARLGRQAELLPSGYRIHAPYRVVVGEAPRFTWSPAVLELYRRADEDLGAGVAAASTETAELRWALAAKEAEVKRLSALEEETRVLRERLEREVGRRLDVERQRDELGRKAAELAAQRDEFLGRVRRHLPR